MQHMERLISQCPAELLLADDAAIYSYGFAEIETLGASIMQWFLCVHPFALLIELFYVSHAPETKVAYVKIYFRWMFLGVV